MNIAEILKNCPKGMKLYSPTFGNVEFEYITPNGNITCHTSHGRKCFYGDGTYADGGERVLFPSKEQRDWNKFLIPFEDGDVIVTTDQTPRYPHENVAIFKEYNGRTDHKGMTIYCQFDANGAFINFNQDVIAHNWRKVTDEERKEFFERLHKEGYDFINGSLVKKFKHGEVVAIYNETFNGYNIGIFDEYLDNRSYKLLCVTNLITNDVEIIDENYDISNGWDTKNARYATHEEKIDLLVKLDKIGYKWKNNRLVKIVKPKFKIGNTITNGKDIVRITNITENFYKGYDINTVEEWAIPIIKEFDWELAKFDLNSLKPYDKVLIKSNSDSCWYPTLVSYVRSSGNVYVIDKNSTVCYVIPFEGNEHLISKEDDPDPYYITW